MDWESYTAAPGALARASGSPSLRKFGKPSIREILVVTSAYASQYTLWGGGRREGNQVSARRGEVSVIFSWREIVRYICATRVFLGGKLRKKWSGHCRRVQTLVF